MAAISPLQIGAIQETIVTRSANENSVAQQVSELRRSHNDLRRRVQNLTGTECESSKSRGFVSSFMHKQT